MSIIIVGGGRLGSFLAGLLIEEKKEKVIVIEKDEMKVEKLKKDLQCLVVNGDGCSPDVLKRAGIHEAKTVVAATGHDEDNVIICQLAKFEYGVSRVVSRISNPKNEWLYTKDMGVDAAVSGARMIAKLMEEEAELSHISTVLNLAQGKISIIKSAVETNAKAANKKISELNLPEGCVIMAIVRDTNVLLPGGKTIILPGDEVLSVVTDECREKLEEILIGLE